MFFSEVVLAVSNYRLSGYDTVGGMTFPWLSVCKLLLVEPPLAAGWELVGPGSVQVIGALAL